MLDVPVTISPFSLLGFRRVLLNVERFQSDLPVPAVSGVVDGVVASWHQPYPWGGDGITFKIPARVCTRRMCRPYAIVLLDFAICPTANDMYNTLSQHSVLVGVFKRIIESLA